MKIELRDTAGIKPYEANPRRNDNAVDAVANSLKEFGFRQPIVVDRDGVVVVGHTRLKAAQRLGLDRVPVHVAEDLTPEQARAYRVADNATAAVAEWDEALLPNELVMIQDAGFDLGVLGFDDEELKRLLAISDATPLGVTDEDDVPAPPEEPVTRPGDVWVLGKHRLLCGDSASAADLDRLLDGGAVHLVNTDPPYNVRVEPRSNNAIAAGNSSFARADGGKRSTPTDGVRKKATHKQMRAKDRPLTNDFVPERDFDALLDAWFGNAARVLVPGGSFYIWGGYANLGNYPGPLKRAGLYFSQAVVWDKQHPVLTRKDFMGAFEICFYGWKEGAAHHYHGPNNATDLWHIKKVNPQAMVHLTEKPVELARRAVEYSSLAGQHVLDLFGGSGSTLIACEQAGRRAFLMEIDPPYCDVIVRRWEQFTGRSAEHVTPASGD